MSQFLAGTAQKIREIVDPLFDGSLPFALLDFPDYDNIGDSAIFVGTMDYLRSRGLFPSYIASSFNCDWTDLEKSIGDGPILLQGGGNFGDIWPWFQDFREGVMTRYPRRPIIQMPQTIHYATEEQIAQTARVIDRHGAYTLLVRDHRSYDLAKARFNCAVHLCPDMAFQIGQVPRGRPTRELLLHMRTDKEAAETRNFDQERAGNADVRDWPTESASDTRIFDLQTVPRALPAYLMKGRSAARVYRYEGRARARFARGAAILKPYRQVITDRLHGHIMCSLLQIPHRVVDNSYGKLGQYIEAWGSDPVCQGIYSDVKAALDGQQPTVAAR